MKKSKKGNLKSLEDLGPTNESVKKLSKKAKKEMKMKKKARMPDIYWQQCLNEKEY